jgi:hypothetical protein
VRHSTLRAAVVRALSEGKGVEGEVMAQRERERARALARARARARAREREREREREGKGIEGEVALCE